MPDNARPQWTMVVTIFHGPTFGHTVEVSTETKGRPDWMTQDSIGSWRGVGIPADVYKQILSTIDAIVSDHLVYRYGVAESLTGWEVEPEPF